MVRKTLLVLLCVFLLVPLAGPAAAAKRATLLGKLVDETETPLQGVQVTVRHAEFETRATTDKKGRFKVVVPDAAVAYEIQFDREGFASFRGALEFDPRGGSHSREWKINAKPPESTGSMEALNAYNEGARAHNAGNDDLALEQFREATAADPEFLEAHAQVAWIELSRGAHEPAATSATRVLELDPQHVSALQILYDAERALGRAGASATLDRLAEVDPSPATAILLYNEGVVARQSGDRERARDRYASATRVDPALGQAHAALAGVFLEAKEYDAALASSERALELDPRDVRGTSIRYNALIGIGRNDEADAMLEELQRLAPDAVAEAYTERGSLLFAEGQIEGAIAALERAIAANPGAARAHYTLGLSYMNRNRNADAQRHLEIFLELAPGDADAGSARQLLEVLARNE